MLRTRSFSLVAAILALGALAGSAQAAKGVKKTSEEHHSGVVTAVTHTATGGTFTIKMHGHKKGTPANAALAKPTAGKTTAKTKTFTFTTTTQFHAVQNKQMKNTTAKAMKTGARVTVTAKSDHAEHVAIQTTTKAKGKNK